jgi:hypothetical protein
MRWPSGSRPRSAGLCRRRTKGPRSLGSKPYTAALLGRGELRLRSLDSLPLAKPTTGHASRSNSRPVITLPRRGQGSTVARHLLCSAAEHDAGIGRATNGRSSSEKSHCLRSIPTSLGTTCLDTTTAFSCSRCKAPPGRRDGSIHGYKSMSKDSRSAVPIACLSCPFYLDFTPSSFASSASAYLFFILRGIPKSSLLFYLYGFRPQL